MPRLAPPSIKPSPTSSRRSARRRAAPPARDRGRAGGPRAPTAIARLGTPLEIERTERRIERESRAAYTDVVAEISRAMALEQAVRSSQQALQATRAGFEAGTRSTADVLMPQKSLRHVETAHALSRYHYALDMLRLRGLAGNLTQEELDLTRSWFE